MRRPVPGLVLIAVAAFVIALLVRLPLSWAVGLLPDSLRCAGPVGTLWNGRCESLQVQRPPAAPVQLGVTHWRLRPAYLLRGQLAVLLSVAPGTSQASALVVLGIGGNVTVRNLFAQAALDPQLMPGLPPSWRGRVAIASGHLQLRKRQLVAIAGVVTARDVIRQAATPTQYGSYEVAFVPGNAAGIPVGKVRDLGGPLQVEGELALTPAFGWQLKGRVAARAGANPELARSLEYLGSPDAQGMRQFSAGSY